MKYRTIVLLVMIISCLGCLYKGCGEGRAENVAPPSSEAQDDVATLPVRAVRVEKVEMSWPIALQGTCVPRYESFVSAKISGTINHILVEEGDFVKEDASMALLDVRELTAQRDQARANLKAVEALLDKLRSGYLKDEVKQAASQLDAAKATYQRLLNDVNRQERLHTAGMIRESDYEDFQTRLQVAKADLERASAAYQLAAQGFRNEEITEAEARVDAARATLELAEIRLQYATVKSPISGWVCERNVNPGEWVNVGQPLFCIQAYDPIWVEAYVAEADIGDITKGLKANIRIQAYPQEVFEGDIQVVGTALDPVTRSLPIKIRIANPDGRLRPALFAQITLYPEPEPSLILPKNAIVLEGETETAARIQAGKIERVSVQTGKRYGDVVAIRSGLVEGDQVVLSDIGGIPDGATVHVTEVSGGLPETSTK